MKFRVLTISAAAALAVVAVPQIATAAWGTVAAGALNLRSCAGVNCSRVAAMPQGARVWIDGAVGGWYRVTYNGVTGYASGRYISTTAAPAVTAAKEPLPAEALRTQAAPAPPPPFGYWWWGDGQYGTWYNGHAPHDSYGHDDPAFLFGFTLAQ